MKIGSGPPTTSPSVARPAAPVPRAAQGQRSFVEVLREGDRARGSTPTPPAPRLAPPTRPPPAAAETSPVARNLGRALDAVNKGEARIDALLDAAAKGKTFTAGELIAMQATVFRYSQTVELLTRATDKLVGAIKQTLGTQV